MKGLLGHNRERGISSSGRARLLQGRGDRFESDILQNKGNQYDKTKKSKEYEQTHEARQERGVKEIGSTTK